MQSATSLGSDTSVPAAQRNPRAFVDDAGVNAGPMPITSWCSTPKRNPRN